MKAAERTALRAAGDRLSRRGGERFVAALERGAAPGAALRAAGASEQVAQLADAARPAELSAALTEIAAALDRAIARRAALRSTALHPVILAVVCLGLCAITAGMTAPLAWVGGPLDAAPRPLSLAPPIAAALLCCALLVLLAAALQRSEPAFPFADGRLRQERALFLSAAAALVARHTPLPAALRGAAQLLSASSLRASAARLAAALERGSVRDEGAPLLGPLGAALFAAAAAEGAADASLAALAEVEEGAAAGELPGLLLRAELLALLLGGVAVAAAGAALFATYASAFGRGP